ncbi:hypothetical protein K3495_g865 [Podosphaera aphanis]|nr:hypothetical protein K3495_g865 [Podosphaera aphanis]
MPESTVLAGLRTYEKLGKLVETYHHNITREWGIARRKAGYILNSGDLALRELTAAHKIKWRPYRAGSSQGSFEGGMNTVEGDALPSVTSSRNHLGAATSNLPPATNIDEAMAACEARIEAKNDTKLASIVALLENRLPGTESAAPPTLSSPAQPITRQS